MICKGLRGRSILSLIRRLVFESRSKLIEQLSFAFSHGLNPPAQTPKNELNPPAVFRQDQTGVRIGHGARRVEPDAALGVLDDARGDSRIAPAHR